MPDLCVSCAMRSMRSMLASGTSSKMGPLGTDDDAIGAPQAALQPHQMHMLGLSQISITASSNHW